MDLPKNYYFFEELNSVFEILSVNEDNKDKLDNSLSLLLEL